MIVLEELEKGGMVIGGFGFIEETDYGKATIFYSQKKENIFYSIKEN